MLDLENISLVEGLQKVADEFPNEVVFSSSFGQEDQIIADAIWKNKLDIRVFTLDTGRLFAETYELMDNTKARYKQSFETYFPPSDELENFVKTKGFNSFYESVENRKECCSIRKLVGLKRALKGAKVWVTGLRAEQSENRGEMKIWEFDESNHIFKYNPLINWTQDEVTQHIDKHNIPQNTLHKKGFVSIGCQPCTRAIEPNEHPRAGRWWWEASKKECGLHN